MDPGSQQSESDSADSEQEVLDLATDASKPKSSGRTWTQAEVDSYVANLQKQSGGGTLRASSGSEVDLTETPRQTVTPTQITPTQVNRTHTHTHTHTVVTHTYTHTHTEMYTHTHTHTHIHTHC